ncbi:AraC family transcriptional regulator [Amycolatopsis pithecellobii]|uniref:Helix-turn-helix domain-containing protein n=1 Tax=Amycolatopsis pithecellobii TaxID=664692 RepID=A0A6N7ZAH2_9PSEU|nr:helix-turn-helix transcriptional regulator [Amycolatopsis pithecellobii]MTD58742.1 helix-turn-helix domain-containing protein [Amycolatopsis pithecellobii]
MVEEDALLGPHLLHIRPGHKFARHLSPGASTRLRAGKLAAGCRASLELVQPQTDYLVAIVLSGRTVCCHSGRYLEAGPTSLLAAGPHQRFEIEWVAHSTVRIMRIARPLLHSRLREHPPEGLVSFAPAVTLLRGIDDTVTRGLTRFIAGSPGTRLNRCFEEIFVDWVLEHQQHSYSGRVETKHANDLAEFAKLLMATEPFAGKEMGYYARRTGVSLAELVAAFEEAGELPHVYLRGVRLDCLRQILSSGQSSSVREAAEQCGFRDKAMLYRWYQERFSEWPWDTWRRRGKDNVC